MNQPYFLDVTLKRQSDDSIQRAIHRKPTWSGQYTHFRSFVPVEIRRNLMVCLSDRIRRLCSEDTVDNELLLLLQVFINNGYSEGLLDKCMKQRQKQDEVSLAAKRVYTFLCHSKMIVRLKLSPTVIDYDMQNILWSQPTHFLYIFCCSAISPQG